MNFLKYIKPYIYPISVFITGACSLIIEIVVVRLLSPYFGNTIYTVSGVITVILAALSFGYYFGGKLADKRPDPGPFFGIISISGLTVLALNFLAKLSLPVLSGLFSLSSGPIITSLLFFFIPGLLLGMLSPYAIKLESLRMSGNQLGSLSGKMFFWSTLGSITGSLLAGFVLIPNMGVNNIFIATGAVLYLLGTIPLLIMKTPLKQLLLFLIFITFATLSFFDYWKFDKGKILYNRDGIYEKITIYKGEANGRPAVFFQQDRSGSGAMYADTTDPTDMVYSYSKYYNVYKAINPNLKNILIIGGEIYTIPKALLYELPDAKIDVVEIEPTLYELAQKYFNLKPDSRLANHVEDGRRFLKDSKIKYDYIFSDAYYSLFSVPSHLTSVEFFTLSKEKLSDEGIFVANLIGDLSRKEPSFIFSEMKTFRQVFPNSYFFAVDRAKFKDSQNIIFVGIKNPEKIVDFKATGQRNQLIDPDRFNLNKYPIITDDYAPTDYMSARVLGRTFGNKKMLDGEEMLAIIGQQLEYGPRYMGSKGKENTSNFIISEMEAVTGKTVQQRWTHKATDGKQYEMINIIGQINPQAPKRIIIGTHYDSKKIADKDSKNNKLPVPGANDSASGVAVLIELARALGGSQNDYDLGIDFIFFDGEEGDVNQSSDYRDWKPLGSTYFAENISEIYKNKLPESAVIIDMVCDKDLKFYKEKSSLEFARTQTKKFWEIAHRKNPDIFANLNGGTIFDNHIALNNADIPSLLIIDFEYPYFHTSADTLDKCSSKSLEVTAEAIYEYIKTI